VFELRGYIDGNGRKRFAKWLDGLEASVARDQE
jgi:hypothetical protein